MFSSVFILCSQSTFLIFLFCCPDNNECESEPCGHGRGLCVNIEGSYKCLCRQGYKHMVQHGKLKCVGKLMLGCANSMLKCFFVVISVIKSCIGSVLSALQMWTNVLSRTSVVLEASASTCPALINVNVTAASGANHIVNPPVKVQTQTAMIYDGCIRDTLM